MREVIHNPASIPLNWAFIRLLFSFYSVYLSIFISINAIITLSNDLRMFLFNRMTLNVMELEDISSYYEYNSVLLIIKDAWLLSPFLMIEHL